jgi:hypothetical protein
VLDARNLSRDAKLLYAVLYGILMVLPPSLDAVFILEWYLSLIKEMHKSATAGNLPSGCGRLPRSLRKCF